MFKFILPLTLLLTIVCYSCSNSTKNELVFNAVVVGHAYGNPDNVTNSVYPKFLEKHHQIYELVENDLLILTGDVVMHGTDTTWMTVEKELNALNVKDWKIALGNHDTGTYLENHIQPEKYMAFVQANNLFIILNTSNAGWTLDMEQREFLEETLLKNDTVDRIFVFSHQLWWLKDSPPYMALDSVRPNSYALYEGESNFWQDAFPFFEAHTAPVYFFGGDLGCCAEIASYYEDHFERFHFYGSGVGGGIEDNFITLKIFQNDSVKIERIDF